MSLISAPRLPARDRLAWRDSRAWLTLGHDDLGPGRVLLPSSCGTGVGRGCKPHGVCSRRRVRPPPLATHWSSIGVFQWQHLGHPAGICVAERSGCSALAHLRLRFPTRPGGRRSHRRECVGNQRQVARAGGLCRTMVLSCQRDTPANATGLRGLPSAPRETGFNAHVAAAYQICNGLKGI